MFSTTAPGDEAFTHDELWVGLNKASQVFWGTTARSDSDSLLAMRLWGAPAHPALSHGCQASVFTVIVAVHFQAVAEMEKVMEIGQVTKPGSSLFLLRISHFSWVNAPPRFLPALISRVLKKLILTIFDVFLTVFMKDCHFYWCPELASWGFLSLVLFLDIVLGLPVLGDNFT